MNPTPETRGGRYRFGQFEFDAATARLWRNGLMVRLQWQPGRVLAMLLAADGEVVSREELQKALWPDDSYGEFDTGLNTAIKKLRQALDDSAQNPRFVETLPRLGYRFLAPITAMESSAGRPAKSAMAPVEGLATEGGTPSGQVEPSTGIEAEVSGVDAGDPSGAGQAAWSPVVGASPGGAPEAMAPVPTVAGAGETAARGASVRMRAAAAMAILALLVVAVAAGRRLVFPARPATPSALRLSIALPADHIVLTNERGRTIAISPDGANVYYAAEVAGTKQIFRRPLSGNASELVPGTDGATGLAVSPDGKRLLFHRNGEAWLIDFQSMQARKVAPPDDSWVVQPNFALGEDGTMFVSGTYRSTGSVGALRTGEELPAMGIFSSKDGERWQLEMPATISRELRGGEFQFPLQVLPDGKLLWTGVWSPMERAVYLRDRRTNTNRLLVEPAMGGHVTRDGTLLYYWMGQLRALPLEGSRRGEQPRIIADNVLLASWGMGQMSASNNGNLVYLEAGPPASSELLWVDESGRESPIPAPARPYSLLDVSPDGKRLLVALAETHINRSVWSYHLVTGEWVRLLDDAPEPSTAVWSPGGKYAVVNSYSGGLRFPNMMAASAQGDSAPRRLLPSTNGQFPHSWPSATGPLAFVRSEVPDTSVDMGLLYPRQRKDGSIPATLEPEPGMEWNQRMLELPGEQRYPAVSPDGALLAYMQGQWPVTEIRVCRLPDCTVQVTVPQSRGGQAPLRNATGDTVYFRIQDGVFASRLTARAASQPAFAPAVKLFAGDYLRPNFWNREMLYDASSRRFLM
nr:winged helix-turn-helix domain-containing protein [Bryobacterales bacterium]